MANPSMQNANRITGIMLLISILALSIGAVVIAYAAGFIETGAKDSRNSHKETRVEFFVLTPEMRFICLDSSASSSGLQLKKCLDVKNPAGYTFNNDYVESYECSHGLCKEL